MKKAPVRKPKNTITLKLPKWAQERHIYIFAGSELLAVKWSDSKKLLIKVDRCNKCGYCCKVFNERGEFKFPVKDGYCAYLKFYSNGTSDCSLSLNDIPFSCCVGDPVLHNWSDKENCAITYEEG